MQAHARQRSALSRVLAEGVQLTSKAWQGRPVTANVQKAVVKDCGACLLQAQQQHPTQDNTSTGKDLEGSANDVKGLKSSMTSALLSSPSH